MLNVRQEKFVQEYVRTGNATNSAIHAGYSQRSAEATASRMLRNDKVRLRITELREKIQESELNDTYDVIKTFENLRSYGMQKEGEKMVDAQLAHRSNQDLARIAGIYKEDNNQKGKALGDLLTDIVG